MKHTVTAYDIEQMTKEELNDFKARKKLRRDFRDETEKNFHRKMNHALKKFLFDIYKDLVNENYELLYEFDFYTPGSDTIISIAESEPAQTIIDNYFTFAINYTQKAKNRRDFIDLNTTYEYYQDCLTKCKKIFFEEANNKEALLNQASVLEEDEPLF